jgi:hypothetical protein
MSGFLSRGGENLFTGFRARRGLETSGTILSGNCSLLLRFFTAVAAATAFGLGGRFGGLEAGEGSS